MSLFKGSKLNHLLTNWPRGGIYTASWLQKQGIPSVLTKKYRDSQWIEAVGRGAMKRKGDKVDWTGGLWAIQKQLGLAIHAGGKTALELSGYGHFLNLGSQAITLFAAPSVKLPVWFKQYNQELRIEYFTTNLFGRSPRLGLTSKDLDYFSIQISTPERAIMEVLYLVPQQQSYEEAWLLAEGLATLRPNLVQKLLESCTRVKVKRLFMYIAEAQRHPWVKRLDLDRVDFGSGKRLIVKGGSLDPKYQIVVPSYVGT